MEQDKEKEVRIGGVLYAPVESEYFMEATIGSEVMVRGPSTTMHAIELLDVKYGEFFQVPRAGDRVRIIRITKNG
jgi:hypothetical protein